MACEAQTWHHGIRLDIKTFVLEFVLTLWCWYVYYIWTKQSSFKKIWMVVLTLWCSSWHNDVHMYNIYEQNKRLLKRWWSWHYDARHDIMMFVLTLRKHALRTYFPPKRISWFVLIVIWFVVICGELRQTFITRIAGCQCHAIENRSK